MAAPFRRLAAERTSETAEDVGAGPAIFLRHPEFGGDVIELGVLFQAALHCLTNNSDEMQAGEMRGIIN
jgi:hypothetical protein